LFWFVAIYAANVMTGEQQVKFKQTGGHFPAGMYTQLQSHNGETEIAGFFLICIMKGWSVWDSN
jgi:hypothetical protein